MSIKYQLRKFIQRLGYDLTRFPAVTPAMLRRKQMLAAYAIDTVLDVGANTGQFARHLRHDAGYTRRILSFEPLSAAFATLQHHAQGDPAWEVFHHALGDADQQQTINIAGNSYSSSLLAMLPAHEHSAPHSRYVGQETVTVKTLDSLFDTLCPHARHIYLKLDTQGFESRVLRGAERSLPRIDTVELEMSLTPLYAGEILFPEMYRLLSEKGYTLVALDEEFADPASGQVLQVNGVFHRSGTAPGNG